MRNLKFNFWTKSLVALSFFTLCFFTAEAQRADGAVGIGAQIGQPTGLTVKVYKPSGISTDILAAWDLDDFFFLNVHGLWERHIGSSENFHYFLGPGAFIGIRDHGNEQENDIAVGVSGNFGINVMLGILELYGQVTPRLEIIEKTDVDIGGGVGLRFYF
ncbi:MAG: hypothetical protein R2879_08280 [Saprospiraceae bacterium]